MALGDLLGVDCSRAAERLELRELLPPGWRASGGGLTLSYRSAHSKPSYRPCGGTKKRPRRSREPGALVNLCVQATAQNPSAGSGGMSGEGPHARRWSM